MKRYKHKILVELWRNRPWKYIPAVVRFMREYPYMGGKNGHFSIWLRNALYLNWQVALKPTRRKESKPVKCKTCEIMKRIETSNDPACCIWYMDNVVCGDKSVEDCDAYEPPKGE